MKILVRERFGEYCTTREQGRNLYLILKSALKMKDVIEVDFSFVRIASSDFLEHSIGKLMKEYNKKAIFTTIKFTHVAKQLEDSIKFTIDFYYRYFRDEEYRYIIDAAFGKTTIIEEHKVVKKIRKSPTTKSIRHIQQLVV